MRRVRVHLAQRRVGHAGVRRFPRAIRCTGVCVFAFVFTVTFVLARVAVVRLLLRVLVLSTGASGWCHLGLDTWARLYVAVLRRGILGVRRSRAVHGSSAIVGLCGRILHLRRAAR